MGGKSWSHFSEGITGTTVLDPESFGRHHGGEFGREKRPQVRALEPTVRVFGAVHMLLVAGKGDILPLRHRFPGESFAFLAS